ncbi:hypothetical protein [Streptomyces sp. NBC_01483]|uniref:hypothetical protein n=1 Tax=Streptomyces sp. NBC_01483 TaxID=2903883 RepID=UPI002E353A2D|nr:hypothetical protein [Streptomyces sp. NBC_01483]
MPQALPDRTIVTVVPASQGWRVDAFAPCGSDTAGVPTPSHVVAWALVADELVPGGATVEPVFYAGERTWTPEQFRAAYGDNLNVKVVPA